MNDIREELAQLRRDVDDLMTRFATGEPSGAYGEGTSGLVNEAVMRHLKASLECQGKSCGIAIARVVVFHGPGGTGCWAGHTTISSASELPQGTKLRESIAALANDPLALRAVRKLIELFFASQPMRMSKTVLAAALGSREDELEASLRPLVADGSLRWSKTAAGEEEYEIANVEPHVLLLQSLE